MVLQLPGGACVTGTCALAARTGSELFVWPAVILYALLADAWAVVSWRSLRHAAGQAGGPEGRNRAIVPALNRRAAILARQVFQDQRKRNQVSSPGDR
ncbi:hypothetical protein [Streptomyces sp. NBC_00344]|uniref:hypothetical protein n=1 Tax=Streptomyces sp. NBC_00344 TaxID=2975720 RepID=UPI002E1B1401